MIVYRPNLLPDPRATAARWRDWCRKNGIGEIYLATTQSFEAVDPGIYGFDAAIEFPPNNSAPPEITESVKPFHGDFSGHIYDWRIFPERSRAYVAPGYMIFRGVNCGWDNFARRPGRGTAFAHFTIEGYREWLTNACRDTVARIHEPSAQLVFINAWNEWAEGAYLEPDRSHGYGKLEATRAALADVSGTAARRADGAKQLVAIAHVFYVDLFDEILLKLTNLPVLTGLVVTCSADSADAVRRMFESSALDCDFRIVEVENRGRDVLPFLQALRMLHLDDDDVVLKVHTKKSLHRIDGDEWRTRMFHSLMERGNATRIWAAFKQRHTLGLVAPENCIVPISTYLGSNEVRINQLLSRAGWEKIQTGDVFSAGSMFYTRYRYLKAVLDLGVTADDFESEMGQIDGTMAHALERFFGIGVIRQGGSIRDAANIQSEANFNANNKFRYADNRGDSLGGRHAS